MDLSRAKATLPSENDFVRSAPALSTNDKCVGDRRFPNLFCNLWAPSIKIVEDRVDSNRPLICCHSVVFSHMSPTMEFNVGSDLATEPSESNIVSNVSPIEDCTSSRLISSSLDNNSFNAFTARSCA